jgi:hypothetical protein
MGDMGSAVVRTGAIALSIIGAGQPHFGHMTACRRMMAPHVTQNFVGYGSVGSGS